MAEINPATGHPKNCLCEKCFPLKVKQKSAITLPPKILWTPCLIPAGQYEGAVFKSECREVKRFGKDPKLYLWFKILTPGQFLNSEIFRSYHYGKISPTSAYAKEWIIANGGERPARWDRLSPSVFENKVFRITVRNAESGLYSVVGSIDALIDGERYEKK